MRKFCKVLSFFALCLIGFNQPQYAVAQNAEEPVYVRATHKNLSRLFWKFQEYSTNDKQKVEDFMRTEECQLYAKYHLDDFAWENILTGAVRDIELFERDYPTHIEIVTIVFLDRYDFQRRAFRIYDKFALKNEGAIEFPFEEYKDIGCPLYNFSDSFPLIMKFSPQNRFLLTHIPVYPVDADALLERLGQYNYPVISELGVRALTGRIRLKINGLNYSNLQEGALYNGRLEEIAFFEDPAMTKPVWVKSLKGLMR